jgi:hypothetical protein
VARPFQHPADPLFDEVPRLRQQHQFAYGAISAAYDVGFQTAIAEASFIVGGQVEIFSGIESKLGLFDSLLREIPPFHHFLINPALVSEWSSIDSLSPVIRLSSAGRPPCFDERPSVPELLSGLSHQFPHWRKI